MNKTNCESINVDDFLLLLLLLFSVSLALSLSLCSSFLSAISSLDCNYIYFLVEHFILFGIRQGALSLSVLLAPGIDVDLVMVIQRGIQMRAGIGRLINAYIDGIRTYTHTH